MNQQALRDALAKHPVFREGLAMNPGIIGSWTPEDGIVRLNGWFSIDQLQVLAQHMRRVMAQKPAKTPHKTYLPRLHNK